ncbi:hypothetical protein GCK32_010238, partial [Trichostrongylus colubriformis]
MEKSLTGSIHGNMTIRDSFRVVFTQYTYLLMVYFIYGIPSLIVTVRIVRAVFKPEFKEFFRTPFFVLFTHECTVNAIFFIIDVSVVRVPLSGLITGWMTTLPVGPYITILYVLSYYSVYMTFYSAAILSLARSIIICSPMQGNE